MVPPPSSYGGATPARPTVSKKCRNDHLVCQHAGTNGRMIKFVLFVRIPDPGRT